MSLVANIFWLPLMLWRIATFEFLCWFYRLDREAILQELKRRQEKAKRETETKR